LPDKLSDNQIGDLLEELRLRLEGKTGETKRGDTTLRALNVAILSLQLGLVKAETMDADVNDAIIDTKKLPPSPSRE
jgi:hypothetical protein